MSLSTVKMYISLPKYRTWI